MKYEDASLLRGDTVAVSQQFPTVGRHYNPAKCCKLLTQQCHIFSNTAVITSNIIIKHILPVTTMMCQSQWCVSLQDTKHVTIISNKKSFLKFQRLFFHGYARCQFTNSHNNNYANYWFHREEFLLKSF